MKILNLYTIEFDKIHRAFIDAFSQYEVPFNLSQKELIYMLNRRGYDPEFSFGIFEDEKIVCFILNGIGSWNALKTAYDTGTGTIKSHQGKGYAKILFEHTVKKLKENNIHQYLLEVIKTNLIAFKLYEKSGFIVSNHFDYYNFFTSDILRLKINTSEDISVEQTSEMDWELFKGFWDFKPSWQNSVKSLERVKKYIKCIVAKMDGKIVGYITIEPHTGDISHLAVSNNYRRKGIGKRLLQNAAKLSKLDSLKIINVLESDEPFKCFMKSMNIEKGKGQFEMVLNL